MANEEVQLLGMFCDKKAPVVTLGESTAGDLIAAHRDAERAYATPDGYVLLASPMDVGLRTIHSAIKAVGDVAGKPSFDRLLDMCPDDLNLLQDGLDKLNTAASLQVEQRGRDNPPAEGNTPDASTGGQNNNVAKK